MTELLSPLSSLLSFGAPASMSLPSLCTLLLLLPCLPHALSSLNEEGIALLSFKHSIQDDPNGSLSNWNSSDVNPCSWSGITCREGRVVSISIPKSRLVGVLPSVLGSLSSLRHINLRDNMLHGSLPLELFEARSLQSLILFGNSLSGLLPSEVGKLTDLQTLDLAENSFNGALPNAVLDCKRLRTLDLGHNSFTGSLPVGFGKSFVLLEQFNLSHNQFSGSIPSDIGNLSSIQGTADFSHNHFSGTIPLSLGNLPEKVYIDLTYNNLSGPIPQSGALINRGPTAFIGNPRLCGPPLRNSCYNVSIPATLPFLPTFNSTSTSNGKTIGTIAKSRSLNRKMAIAIVVGDVVGITLLGLLLFYCYRKLVSCKSEVSGSSPEKERREEDCLCFRKDESESQSDYAEHSGFVSLDLQVDFDLDKLLKASAFILGKSGIGIVYKAVLEDGVTMAVRRLGDPGLQRFKEFKSEIEVIGKLRHPNIVTLRAYYWSVDERLLIYNYIPNGNLAAAIYGNAGTSTFLPLSWHARLKIMKGIAQGLVYLHEFSPKKYVHGNLKPTNILLGLDMEPYISDFGLGSLTNITGMAPTQSSQTAAETQQNQSSDISTMVSDHASFYQAPEALKLRKPSQKWDVYSYGVILLEMLSGRSTTVLVDASTVDLVRWVRLNIEEKKPLSDNFDPYLAQEREHQEEMMAVLKIALACVQTNAEQRPSMRHALNAFDSLVSRS